jgi:hypothetical protein
MVEDLLAWWRVSVDSIDDDVGVVDIVRVVDGENDVEIAGIKFVTPPTRVVDEEQSCW